MDITIADKYFHLYVFHNLSSNSITIADKYFHLYFFHNHLIQFFFQSVNTDSSP